MAKSEQYSMYICVNDVPEIQSTYVALTTTARKRLVPFEPQMIPNALQESYGCFKVEGVSVQVTRPDEEFLDSSSTKRNLYLVENSIGVYVPYILWNYQVVKIFLNTENEQRIVLSVFENATYDRMNSMIVVDGAGNKNVPLTDAQLDQSIDSIIGDQGILSSLLLEEDKKFLRSIEVHSTKFDRKEMQRCLNSMTS